MSRATSKAPPWAAVRLVFQSDPQSEPASASRRPADRQPHHRRRGRGRRRRVVQQVGELEHVRDLLPRPGPEAIEDHRQGELVEPPRPPASGGPDGEEDEDRRQAGRQQGEPDREAEPGPPVEDDQHRRRRRQHDRRVDRELQGQLEAQAPAQPRELGPEQALLVAEGPQFRQVGRDRHGCDLESPWCETSSSIVPGLRPSGTSSSGPIRRSG